MKDKEQFNTEDNDKADEVGSMGADWTKRAKLNGWLMKCKRKGTT